MHRRIARNKCAVVHRRMPPQQRPIRKNHLVSQSAVMPNVTAGHQEILRPHYCLRAGRARTMDGHVFAKHISVTNLHSRRRTTVFQILRRFSNHTPCKEAIARANHRLAGNINMRPDHTPRPKADAFINYCVRSNLDARIELRFRVNDCGGMNHDSKVKQPTRLPSPKFRYE